jgi:hypothetical protein
MSNPKYATIQFTVNSLSSLQHGCFKVSETYHWYENLFYIEAGKCMDDNYPYLEIYLGCEGKKLKWSCFVVVEVKLINQLGQADVTTSLTSVLFTEAMQFHVFRNIYAWNNLLNEGYGFLKNDSFTIVVKIERKT